MQGIHTDQSSTAAIILLQTMNSEEAKSTFPTPKKKSKPRLTKLDSINQQKTLF